MTNLPMSIRAIYCRNMVPPQTNILGVVTIWTSVKWTDKFGCTESANRIYVHQELTNTSIFVTIQRLKWRSGYGEITNDMRQCSIYSDETKPCIQLYIQGLTKRKTGFCARSSSPFILFRIHSLMMRDGFHTTYYSKRISRSRSGNPPLPSVSVLCHDYPD